jgi:hypothetical protein
MRILLDECIPRKLKYSLPDHQCRTVPEAGLAGKKNGPLLGGWFPVQLLMMDRALRRVYELLPNRDRERCATAFGQFANLKNW